MMVMSDDNGDCDSDDYGHEGKVIVVILALTDVMRRCCCCWRQCCASTGGCGGGGDGDGGGRGGRVETLRQQPFQAISSLHSRSDLLPRSFRVLFHGHLAVSSSGFGTGVTRASGLGFGTRVSGLRFGKEAH